MSINFYDLLEKKARKYGASAESPTFQQLVIDAGNAVLDDMENEIGVSTTRIDAVNEEIDIDEQLYENLMSQGMDTLDQTVCGIFRFGHIR